MIAIDVKIAEMLCMMVVAVIVWKMFAIAEKIVVMFAKTDVIETTTKASEIINRNLLLENAVVAVVVKAAVADSLSVARLIRKAGHFPAFFIFRVFKN